MKKCELLPTEENLIKALQRNMLKRNGDLVYFYNILQAQESVAAIALDGKWGSGKTFFVRQEKMLINALNSTSCMNDEMRDSILQNFALLEEKGQKNSLVAIYYDAWENDNDIDPMLSIIYEITKQLNIDFSLSDKNISKVIGAITEAITGRNINSIIDTLSSDDLFTKLKMQKTTLENIKIFLGDILNERGDRLVIFIDELDRCKPNFAIRLLEQIKHYFCDDRIIFVFSVNLEQLQYTIKHHYGVNFDSCRYLDRFFDLRIAIPPADLEQFYNEMGLDSSYYVELVTRRIINMFHFELREITRFYTQVKAAVYDATHENDKYDFSFFSGNGRHAILVYIVPLLIALKMVDITKYNNFVNGVDGTPLQELFSSEELNHILKYMLNNGESFDKEKGESYVKIEELINRFYKAVFVEEYSNGDLSTTLGNYEFNKNSKELALRAENMMSEYAELS